MYRSFTDRMLGGVCGGLGTAWPVSPWLLRAVFAIYAIVSLGAGVLLYLALWWALPQESLADDRRGTALWSLLALAVIVVMVGAWIGEQTSSLQTDGGTSLYWPLLLVSLSAVFLLRQIRG